MSSREVKREFIDVYSKEHNHNQQSELTRKPHHSGLIAQVTKLEEKVYGCQQKGSLIKRLEGLEKTISPSTVSNSAKLEGRLRALSEALSGSGPAKVAIDGNNKNKQPSLKDVVSKIERELDLKPDDPNEGLDQRIKSAEKVLRGAEATGGLYDRAKKIYEEIFGEG